MRKTPRRFARQRLLFELDPPAMAFEEPPIDVNPPPPVCEAPEQLQLFEGKTPLLGELEQALVDADFEKAVKVKAKLSADYGPEAVPADDAARALSFWQCLCAVGLGKSLSEKLLHGARRRMKLLHPELHAVFMGELRR